MQEAFRKFAHSTAEVMGSFWSFIIAITVILVWLITGPIFNFSDSWQLVINTGTTIVTFLMVFLIQNTQNRDAKAIQLKLDELIRSSKGAKNAFLDLEELSDAELDGLQQQFNDLYQKQRIKRQGGFAVVGVLLVFVVAAVAAGGLWWSRTSAGGSLPIDFLGGAKNTPNPTNTAAQNKSGKVSFTYPVPIPDQLERESQQKITDYRGEVLQAEYNMNDDLASADEKLAFYQDFFRNNLRDKGWKSLGLGNADQTQIGAVYNGTQLRVIIQAENEKVIIEEILK